MERIPLSTLSLKLSSTNMQNSTQSASIWSYTNAGATNISKQTYANKLRQVRKIKPILDFIHPRKSKA